MGMTFTTEQQQVIDLRERNLLVSAAAGSGKTAVLVERIIKRITDAEHPVDIDRLLIVTFTNAAAAEMRERIGTAVEKRLEELPEDVHLQRQQTLLHNAKITTIHSFCLFVIRNYFHRIDLEPDFRIGEEGELKLLKGDVLGQLLERCYKEADPAFLQLTETMAPGKNDEQLREAILSLYEFSRSDPWPRDWLEQCILPYRTESEEEFEALPLCHAVLEYCGALTGQWADLMEECIKICREDDGPELYEPLLVKELEMLKGAQECRGLREFYEKITSLTFGRLPAARKFTGSAEKKKLVMDTRNGIKDSRKKLVEQFFFQPPEDMIKDLHKNRTVIETLVGVTLDFAAAFGEKKREKNMLDFSDLEHFALEILVSQETGEPSRTAEELQQVFEEIMIDEYQDSNYVQEAILKSVSGEREGRNNLFMVGDVKQSIYRFRMARPELFMEKYDRYTVTDSENQRIDLHKNFRSRTEVLDTVNDVFFRIMGKDLGNVEYDENAALYPGMEFPMPADPGQFQTEVLAVDLTSFEEAGTGTEGWDAKDAEAAVIAVRIQELKKSQMVTDRESGELRPVNYGDMVILLRSVSGFAPQLIPVLGEYGIPAHATTGTGYFSAREVQTVLNMLRLIDNPRQDIPMAAVLQSPIGNVSGEEMACIRIQFPQCPFYHAVLSYRDQGEQDILRGKIRNFLDFLERFRERAGHTAIHELLYQVMEESGYWDYVYALPGGQVRRANLEMLLEKAIAYEGSSYRGLFHFIRYINQLQKYEVDFGEAEGENHEDAVRIMSIHKSKGLELPVVIVAGMGRQFNQQDIRNRLVLHPQLGIGLDVVDLELRTRMPSLTRQALARRIQVENAGEELRILYVALTRAREKLILSGTLKKGEEKLNAMERQIFDRQGHMGFLARLTAAGYFDWVLPALKSYGDKYEIRLLGPRYLAAEQSKGQLEQDISRLELMNSLETEEKQWKDAVEQRLSFQYPYQEEAELKTKLSVSELKHRAMDLMRQEETDTDYVYQEEAPVPYVPAFMQGIQEESLGALRGTAMHRVLECFDFTADFSSLNDQLDQMTEDGRLEERLRSLVSLPGLAVFFDGALAERMQSAAKRGLLYKEKPFVMGKPANQVLEAVKSDAMVLIQGIIDAFFEEDGELVLVDYKTDSVTNQKELTERYRAQMELYREALERAFGKPVKEIILYSFKLQKALTV